MKKIMFNDRFGLTESVIYGRKTQTRRILPEGTPLGNWKETVKKSRYQAGDVVAVAQRYSELAWDQKYYDSLCDMCKGLPQYKLAGWDNKMFVQAKRMPHRIRINSICVQRLQDITDDECLAEGISDWSVETKKLFVIPDYKSEDFICFDNARNVYARLIDEICGDCTWDSNPYVFAYTFELIR